MYIISLNKSKGIKHFIDNFTFRLHCLHVNHNLLFHWHILFYNINDALPRIQICLQVP